jgi:hypothetical protein
MGNICAERNLSLSYHFSHSLPYLESSINKQNEFQIFPSYSISKTSSNSIKTRQIVTCTGGISVRVIRMLSKLFDPGCVERQFLKLDVYLEIMKNVSNASSV